jgi:hypothetical protein
MRRRVIGLVERAVLGAGMAIIAFAIERQLTAALAQRSVAARGAGEPQAISHGPRLRIIGAAGARSWPWLLQRSRH